jgi:hypothetical protein
MRGDPDIADLAKFEISHKSLHGRENTKGYGATG